MLEEVLENVDYVGERVAVVKKGPVEAVKGPVEA